ncbi:hypothetical protein BC829DRAFT_419748 [Chytridium lagenaria]|nr:hypothetical protein BC829DRAFT_419748 [Chytridium lagenaria]
MTSCNITIPTLSFRLSPSKPICMQGRAYPALNRPITDFPRQTSAAASFIQMRILSQARLSSTAPSALKSDTPEPPRQPKAPYKKKKGIRDVGSDEEFATGPSIITAPNADPFRATAFSTSENYNFQTLLPILQKRFVLLPYIADDVFHIRIADPATVALEQSRLHHGTSEDDPTPLPTANDAEAFFFSDGTFVTWGAKEAQIEQLLEVAEDVGVGRYGFVESEWFDYFVDMAQPSGISADTIIIGYDIPPHQAMLAFSSGLARSAKLSALETLLDSHLNKNRHIPQVLLLGKKIPLNRSAVLRNLGELFSLRGHLNLHSELLDSPDFCWSSSKMESCFERISRNLDVRPRIAVFNKKLDYANELTEVLRNHLHEQHSLKLECIEILFEMVHFWNEWRVGNKEEKVLADLAAARLGEV